MEKFRYIVVILVYRNSDDLLDCIDSVYLAISNPKIIIVNSFFDDQSEKTIRNIAKEKNCDFISVENKGYGFGNNKGMAYAMSHYQFDYIIISNPDIVIKEFRESEIDAHPEFDIIAPCIITLSGKYQNPMLVIRNRIGEYLEYKGFCNNSKFLVYAGIGMNKVLREIILKINKRNEKPYRIYEAHGSFVILTRKAIDLLFPVYDEKMFLFGEEGVLALKANRYNLKTGQFNNIIIHHKEDGSMKLSELSISEEQKKSNLYFFRNYIFKKKSRGEN